MNESIFRRAVIGTALAVVVAGAGIGVTALPAQAATTTFTFSGTTQTYLVPDGVTQLQVTATGASGGEGEGGSVGGRGAVVSATVQVQPFQTLYVNVGGRGGEGSTGGDGGFNGNGDGAILTSTGGGGGGATDVRFGTQPADRVLVAGGGGGGGGGDDSAPGGDAGDDGATGAVPGTAGKAGTVGHYGSISANGGSAGDANPDVGSGGNGGDSGGGATAGGGGGGGGWHGAGGGGSNSGSGAGGGGGGGSSHAPNAPDGAPAPLITTSGEYGDGSLSITAIRIATSSLPAAFIGSAYTAQLNSDDPAAQWSVAPELWSGLTLGSDGTISGTIASEPNIAPRDFTFTATNATTGASSSKVLTLNVANGLPGAPTDLQATRGDNSAHLIWTEPETGGTPSGYRIQKSLNAGTTWTTVVADTKSTALDYTVGGLVNGTEYLVRVAGINRIGSQGVGEYSDSVAVTPATVPGSPTDLSVGAVTRTNAVVSYVAPEDDGGAAISEYLTTATPGGLTCRSATLSCRFDSLRGGTRYTFKTKAINDVGAGVASEASAEVVAAGVPSKVTGFRTVARGNALYATWYSPSDNGGSPVLGYDVIRNGRVVCSLPARGSSFACRTGDVSPAAVTVVAKNAVGAGARSTLQIAATFHARRSGLNVSVSGQTFLPRQQGILHINGPGRTSRLIPFRSDRSGRFDFVVHTKTADRRLTWVQISSFSTARKVV